jgi:hypothetical protein
MPTLKLVRAAPLFLCLLAMAAPATEYYVAPGGSDTNAGTSIGAPFKSLTKLSTVMVAGDHAYVRGGTYAIARSIVPGEDFELLHYMTGTSAQPIVVENYPGEQPVFDFTGSTYVNGANALLINHAHHLHVKGLRFTRLAQMPGGAGANGVQIANSTHCILERIEVDHIGVYGFVFSPGAHDNLLRNCDAHHIADPYSPNNAYHGANGFNITGGSDAERTTFDGCRAWFCSDDGFDLYSTNGFVTITNCWAFWNGVHQQDNGTIQAVGDGKGFKLGPLTQSKATELKRVVVGNLAFENLVGGFDENVLQADRVGIFHLYNNTSYHNGSIGSTTYDTTATGFASYTYPSVSHDVRNNISVLEPAALQGTEWLGTSNSWNLGITLTATDFQSLSTAGVDGPRQADGSLPNLPFLKPASSALIDRGANVGRAYRGTAPDLGAFEATSGSLQFSVASLSITEGTGGASTITVTVTRTGGSDGAVSANYATSNGTATAGSDYTASSGVLSWTSGDAAAKTFVLSVASDAAVEANETVSLTLSAATGGATLGLAAAVLTIADDDGPGAGGAAGGAAAVAAAPDGDRGCGGGSGLGLLLMMMVAALGAQALPRRTRCAQRHGSTG